MPSMFGMLRANLTCRQFLKHPLTWTICFVLLGVGVRSFHYLRNPSMWHDEAALVLNVLDKGFGSYFGPLHFAEAAPPLFLAAERATVLQFGDGTFSLRLIPFLASLGSIGLLVYVARRLLTPGAVPWAVLFFACSDSLLWHACEAKPYAVDAFLALSLAAILIACREWPIPRLCLLLSVLAPIVILVAFPGCFLYGGVLVALLPAVWSSRQIRSWFPYCLLAAVVFATFAFLYLGPIRAQRCGPMDECWVRSFAPWETPRRVPIWLIGSIGSLFNYCIGTAAQVLILPCVLGTICLRQRGEQRLLAYLLVPIGLALAASLVKAYPFGGSRVVVYAAPALCLLSAEGIITILAWSSRPVLNLGICLLLLIPTTAGLRTVVRPWKRANGAAASNYVLERRDQDEPVIGNHWEHIYYFRHLGSSHFHICGEQWPMPERLWIVTTAGTMEDRRGVVNAFFPPGIWQELDRKEFELCSVVKMGRVTESEP